MNPIVPFYSGTATDDHGRYLKDLQTWPDDSLESVHNFIQWMFPLLDRSGANPDAPVLDRVTIDEFHSRPELQDTLRQSFFRMLKFYGLESDASSITRARNFRARASVWLYPGSHNHLRITRILKSLRLLGLQNEADRFFQCLSEIYRDHPESITPQSFRFWQSAARGSHTLFT